jgi:hypothetical protein
MSKKSVLVKILVIGFVIAGIVFGNINNMMRTLRAARGRFVN